MFLEIVYIHIEFQLEPHVRASSTFYQALQLIGTSNALMLTKFACLGVLPLLSLIGFKP